MAPRPAAWALALAALCVLSTAARAGIMASSKLTSCVNDGTTPSTSLSCSQKIVVTLELENNKIYETEDLTFGVACVNSPTDQCPCPCNYVNDPSCQCRDLRQNITVAATKSPVFASYPLTFVKAFLGKLTEEVIVGSDCADGEFDRNPTCGWVRNSNGDIQDSQGFCCGCPAINFGGTSNLNRGGFTCGLFNRKKSAHCMRWDNYWLYAGHTIGEYTMDFDINLAITTRNVFPSPPPPDSAVPTPDLPPSNPVLLSKTEILKITPSQPFQRDSSRRVSAKLLGDLESYQQAPQLAGKWLFMPYKGQGIGEARSQNRDEWMVLERSMVTTTGLECDKVGVSFSGFRNSQPNACETVPGSCLRNQLYDLYNEDMRRIYVDKKPPVYFITRYGGGEANTQQVKLNHSTTEVFLRLPLPAIKTSLMTLTVAADDVIFTVKNSPASIQKVEVCSFDGRLCGGFESLSSRGYLLVDVKNEGYVPADFTVEVANCTAGVKPVMAQRAGIMSQSSRRFQFELYMTTDQATNSSCSVSVVDAIGGRTATRAISFYTNATIYDDGLLPLQPGVGDDKVKYSNGNRTKEETCNDECPGLFNVVCSAKLKCYARMWKGVASIAGTAIGGLLGVGGVGYLMLKTGGFSFILRLISSCISCILCRPAASPPPVAPKSKLSKDKQPPRRRRRVDSGYSTSGSEGEEEGEAARRRHAIKAAAKGAAAAPASAGKPAGRKATWWRRPSVADPQAQGSAHSGANGDASAGSTAGASQAPRQQLPPLKHTPYATEPPEPLLRQRSRRRSSFAQAAEQARDVYWNARQYMISNPLAAGVGSPPQAPEWTAQASRDTLPAPLSSPLAGAWAGNHSVPSSPRVAAWPGTAAPQLDPDPTAAAPSASPDMAAPSASPAMAVPQAGAGNPYASTNGPASLHRGTTSRMALGPSPMMPPLAPEGPLLGPLQPSARPAAGPAMPPVQPSSPARGVAPAVGPLMQPAGPLPGAAMPAGSSGAPRTANIAALEGQLRQVQERVEQMRQSRLRAAAAQPGSG